MPRCAPIRAKTYAPRVKIIAGKAAPGYQRAKLLIKLAHDVASVINSDPAIGDRLKLVFIPNYNVSLAETIIPAADLSEQISTAGMEASGTGNMKLALNGALTIGTLDGANIEIRDHVGADHFFLFGMTADDVEQRRRDHFEGISAVRESEPLQAALQLFMTGAFAPDDPARYSSFVDALLGIDPFMVAADFSSYWASSARGRQSVAGPSTMVPIQHPEHSADGLVQLRPRRAGICRRDLACSGES